MTDLNTNNSTIEIIQESGTVKSNLAEKWNTLSLAWGRLKRRIERLFELYQQRETSQNENERQITNRDDEITRLKNEILATIDQINVLNPELQNMTDEMDGKLEEFDSEQPPPPPPPPPSDQLPGNRDQTERREVDDVRIPADQTGGYRYKTPNNRRKTKSKSKTRSKSKSKSPSKSKKSKKSRRKSKY
tara:strand:+ start:3741 stop:4307 length:567 start_codon:yes stop_codon:yes gene_type:complete